MIRRDRISALFFVGLSSFICQQSLVIGLGTPETPGAGMLSFGAGVGMGVLSLWLLIQSFRSNKAVWEARDNGAIRWGKILLACLCLFGYALVVDWLGFVMTTFMVVVALFFLLDVKKGWLVVIGAAFIALGNYLLFVKLLGLSLPRGFLGW